MARAKVILRSDRTYHIQEMRTSPAWPSPPSWQALAKERSLYFSWTGSDARITLWNAQ